MQTRRVFVQGALAAPALLSFPRAALALDYPVRRVNVVVTVAPGGSSDVVTRLTAQSLADRLGQPFVIENRPGAGGNIAAESVLRAPADGYSLLSINKGSALYNLLYPQSSMDFNREFVPVAGIATGPLTLLVHPTLPVKTFAEFLAYAKANPDKIAYGSPGMGSDPHLASEFLKMAAGINLAHVPYRGGALALTDLLAGNLQMMFSNLPSGEFVKAGKLRALAVTSAARTKELPDLPAIAEYLPGYEVGVWFAYVARRDTPAEIVQKLNAAISAALSEPRVAAGIAALSAMPMRMTPEELGKLFAAEAGKWSKVIKAANIKVE